MADEIHVADVLTIFRVFLVDAGDPLPLAGNNLLEIIFLKPDRTRVVNTAVVFGNEANGVIEYQVTANTELNIPGPWKIQAHVRFTTTGEWSSEIQTFPVHENL